MKRSIRGAKLPTMPLTLLALWLFMSGFMSWPQTLALQGVCACWPSGLYSGLPDYGQEIDPAAASAFFSSDFFSHELFMNVYMRYVVRGLKGDAFFNELFF